MLKPLPSIEEVFNMVCQDERQRVLKPVTNVENVAFQASGSSQAPVNDHFAAYSNYMPRPRPVCTHCGMVGHVVNKCFKLHGYPPSYEGYKGNQLGSKGSYVPKPNNIAQRSTGQQWKTSPHNYNKENVIPHVVNDALVSPNMHMGSHTMYSALPCSSLDLNSFSVEQVHSLTSWLHVHANVQEASTSHSSPSITEHGVMACNATAGTISFPSSNLRFTNQNLTCKDHCLSSLSTLIPSDAWIVDSGATSHVCSSLSLFTEFKEVENLTVTLTNGTTVPIMHIGIVKLTLKMSLHHVLHIPSFKFSLISVSSMLASSLCSAHFFQAIALFNTILWA